MPKHPTIQRRITILEGQETARKYIIQIINNPIITIPIKYSGTAKGDGIGSLVSLLKMFFHSQQPKRVREIKMSADRR